MALSLSVATIVFQMNHSYTEVTMKNLFGGIPRKTSHESKPFPSIVGDSLQSFARTETLCTHYRKWNLLACRSLCVRLHGLSNFESSVSCCRFLGLNLTSSIKDQWWQQSNVANNKESAYTTSFSSCPQPISRIVAWSVFLVRHTECFISQQPHIAQSRQARKVASPCHELGSMPILAWFDALRFGWVRSWWDFSFVCVVKLWQVSDYHQETVRTHDLQQHSSAQRHDWETNHWIC